MTIYYLDSFSDWTTIKNRFYSVNDSTSSETAAAYIRRTGNQCVCFIYHFGQMAKKIDPVSTLAVGFAYREQYAQNRLANGTIVAFSDTAGGTGGTVQGSLYINANSYLEYRRGTTNILGTSLKPYFALDDRWHYVEVKVVVSDSVGEYEVRIDGETVISGSNADTKASSSKSTIEAISFNGNFSANTGPGGIPLNTYMDDLYIASDFLGPIVVDTLLPNGDGYYSDFDGSDSNKVNNYQLVDDYAVADYVYSSSSNVKDSYAMQDLGFESTIYATQTNIYLRVDSGIPTIKPLIRVSSTDYEGTTLVNAYNSDIISIINEVNPNTSTAWSKTTINSAEFGVKIS